MYVTFFDREFGRALQEANVRFVVDNYSWSVFGGPYKAKIMAYADSVERLYRLIKMLRYGVMIESRRGEAVWWGYVDSVYVNHNKFRIGYSLREFANKVAVGYDSLSQRFTTDWVSDAESVAEYGTKEYLHLASRITSVEAEALRDRILEERKYPVPDVSFAEGTGDYAEINCLSWGETLKWRYYGNSVGYEGYESQSGRIREVGEDERPKCAQKFKNTSSENWTAKAVWIKVQTYASAPTDGLRVSIYSNNASDKPGTELAYGIVSGALLPGDRLEWIKFALNTGVNLVAGTSYWVVVQRTGAIDKDRYYAWETNSNGGYLNGYIRLYNTEERDWVIEPNNYPGDMLFRVVNEVDTTEVMSNIVNSCAEFLTGIDIETTSGILTSTFRSGDLDAYNELMRLIDIGTSSGQRLLYHISPSRRMRVYVEESMPDESMRTYTVDSKMTVRDKYGKEVLKERCPVGYWARYEDVMPLGIDILTASNSMLFFVEEASYHPEADEYKITRTRSIRNYLDFGVTID